MVSFILLLACPTLESLKRQSVKSFPMINGKSPQILLVVKFPAFSITDGISWGGLLLPNGNLALRRACGLCRSVGWVKLPVEEATPSMAETLR